MRPVWERSDGTYIIAEAGVNHDGSLEKAHSLIDIAAAAEVDAVKFQLFDTDEIVHKDAPLAAYQKDAGETSQYEMVQRLYLPPDDFRELQQHAVEAGLDFITTPFDAESAHFLASLDVPALKTPSGELTNAPYLEQIAALHIPTILSTGMSSIGEIEEAIEPFKKQNTPYALLHCVSSYPTPADQVHLAAMTLMRRHFGVPIGFSDHTEGIDIAILAAALGARILEKHFTVCKTDPGPDHSASLEAEELKKMTQRIRTLSEGDDKRMVAENPMLAAAIGQAVKECQPCERDVRSMARRSVILLENASAGDVLTAENVGIKRPGTGIEPKYHRDVLGKTLLQDVAAGTPLTREMVEGL